MKVATITAFCDTHLEREAVWSGVVAIDGDTREVDACRSCLRSVDKFLGLHSHALPKGRAPKQVAEPVRGEYACTARGCGRTFATEGGLKRHRTMMHSK